jgi:hypothetical protein
MQLTLRHQLIQFSHTLQHGLFPIVEEAVGELSTAAKLLVAIINMTPLRRFIPVAQGWRGRPQKDRYAIACAFLAKAAYNLPTTSSLIQRLKDDEQLRRLCGWRRMEQIPHECTFSRAFAEFAAMELGQFVHEVLIRETQSQRLVGHIARDSTAITAREHFPEGKPKAVPIETVPKKKSSPRGRKIKPRKMRGGRLVRLGPPTRLKRQRSMALPQMLAELSRECSIGVKVSTSGYSRYWRGYKLHLDVADGQIPISAVLTGASVHDSQVAIPLATITAQRVTSLYDLMDSAYDAYEIIEHSRSLGHVPIITPKNFGRRSKNVIVRTLPRQLSWAEQDRFRERTMIERVYSRLKDEFGGRNVRVRGARKVMAHLMFGLLALTVDQLLRLSG